MNCDMYNIVPCIMSVVTVTTVCLSFEHFNCLNVDNVISRVHNREKKGNVQLSIPP